MDDGDPGTASYPDSCNTRAVTFGDICGKIVTMGHADRVMRWSARHGGTAATAVRVAWTGAERVERLERARSGPWSVFPEAVYSPS
jgi:hypothetical protein